MHTMKFPFGENCNEIAMMFQKQELAFLQGFRYEEKMKV